MEFSIDHCRTRREALLLVDCSVVPSSRLQSEGKGRVYSLKSISCCILCRGERRGGAAPPNPMTMAVSVCETSGRYIGTIGFIIYWGKNSGALWRPSGWEIKRRCLWDVKSLWQRSKQPQFQQRVEKENHHDYQKKKSGQITCVKNSRMYTSNRSLWIIDTTLFYE